MTFLACFIIMFITMSYMYMTGRLIIHLMVWYCRLLFVGGSPHWLEIGRVKLMWMAWIGEKIVNLGGKSGYGQAKFVWNGWISLYSHSILVWNVRDLEPKSSPPVTRKSEVWWWLCLRLVYGLNQCEDDSQSGWEKWVSAKPNMYPFMTRKYAVATFSQT